KSGEISNRNFFATTDINKAYIRVVLHQEHAGICQVVDSEKFTARRASTPYRHMWLACQLGGMKTANESSRHVTILRVIIVPWTVKIRRHHRYEICSMLQAVCFAKLDPSDLSDSVPLVSGLKRSRQQHFFGHRLWR